MNNPPPLTPAERAALLVSDHECDCAVCDDLVYRYEATVAALEAERDARNHEMEQGCAGMLLVAYALGIPKGLTESGPWPPWEKLRQRAQALLVENEDLRAAQSQAAPVLAALSKWLESDTEDAMRASLDLQLAAKTWRAAREG